jgi:cytoskeleton protein RodZ
VFEIGTTLREARVRRKLTLQQVEEDTKIRVKYLQAMENEDFDVMPGATYVKGFLRTYATYLGLDARIVLDEYGSRPHRTDTPEPFGGSSALRPRVHRRRNTLVFVAVVCLLILGVLYTLGLGREEASVAPPSRPDVLGIESASPSPVESASPKATPTETPTEKPVPADQVRVTATTGDCWLQVRRGSATGEIVYEGTLVKGSRRTWRGDPLWLRIGSPVSVRLRLGGENQPVLDQADPLDVLVRDGALTVQR